MRLTGILRIMRLRIPLAIAAVMAVTGCSASVPSHRAPASPAEATYYLALGDSLSQGVQPDAGGASVETPYGYPDQVYAALRRSHPTLRLVKLGCPGETTSTMINGGICRYQGGSQLAAAVAFLRAHRGRVLLVTIDIGANDPEDCGGQPGLGQLASCAVKGIPEAVTHLTTIMSSLKAAGPGVRMVGMTYYLPALAEWRDGLPGHVVAWAAERLAAAFNELLDRVYVQSGARVANVFGAFDSGDFASNGAGRVPRNVALLCQWTWECAAPPRGPNQHANQVGYQVIARTFLQAADLG
ncbi:MAG: SGNH/GDSL hydrolase family protein [Streptosporangiaceae bacterium]